MPVHIWRDIPSNHSWWEQTGQVSKVEKMAHLASYSSMSQPQVTGTDSSQVMELSKGLAEREMLVTHIQVHQCVSDFTETFQLHVQHCTNHCPDIIASSKSLQLLLIPPCCYIWAWISLHKWAIPTLFLTYILNLAAAHHLQSHNPSLRPHHFMHEPLLK